MTLNTTFSVMRGGGVMGVVEWMEEDVIWVDEVAKWMDEAVEVCDI